MPRIYRSLLFKRATSLEYNRRILIFHSEEALKTTEKEFHKEGNAIMLPLTNDVASEYFYGKAVHRSNHYEYVMDAGLTPNNDEANRCFAFVAKDLFGDKTNFFLEEMLQRKGRRKENPFEEIFLETITESENNSLIIRFNKYHPSISIFHENGIDCKGSFNLNFLKEFLPDLMEISYKTSHRNECSSFHINLEDFYSSIIISLHNAMEGIHDEKQTFDYIDLFFDKKIIESLYKIDTKTGNKKESFLISWLDTINLFNRKTIQSLINNPEFVFQTHKQLNEYLDNSFKEYHKYLNNVKIVLLSSIFGARNDNYEFKKELYEQASTIFFLDCLDIETVRLNNDFHKLCKEIQEERTLRSVMVPDTGSIQGVSDTSYTTTGKNKQRKSKIRL